MMPTFTDYNVMIRLSTYTWESDPLIVDLSDNNSIITPAVHIEIINTFRAIRLTSSDPHHRHHHPLNMPMYIITSCDKVVDFEATLAVKSPEKAVLGMIVQAAKLSAKRLLSWMASASVSGDFLPQNMMSRSSSYWQNYQVHANFLL